MHIAVIQRLRETYKADNHKLNKNRGAVVNRALKKRGLSAKRDSPQPRCQGPSSYQRLLPTAARFNKHKKKINTKRNSINEIARMKLKVNQYCVFISIMLPTGQQDYPCSILIVSITKFSIVIGSPRAYLSRNRQVITWVSNYRCPI